MSTNEELVLRAEQAAAQVASDKAEIQAMVTKLEEVQAPSIAASKEDIKQALIAAGQTVDDTVPFSEYGNKVRAIQSMDFYKCASVDTTNKTWTGYKAVLGDGVYTFEETATTGLTYGTAYTSSVNKIYNADATIQVTKLWDGNTMPTDGLLFYAPLSESTATAETGQSLTAENITWGTVDNVPCATMEGNGNIETTNNIGISGNTEVTIAAKIKASGSNTTTSAVNVGYSNTGQMLGIGENNGKVFVTGYAHDYTSEIDVTDQFHHVAATYSNGTITLYVDGVLVHSYEASLNIAENTLTIGNAHGGYYFNGSIAEVCVYSKVLSADEISALATAAAAA